MIHDLSFDKSRLKNDTSFTHNGSQEGKHQAELI